MRHIWEIYKTDWQRVFRVPMVLLLILAIGILPSMYAGVNIASVWDPYKNTSGINVAVVNEDEGATVRDKKLHIGEDVVHNLKDNKKLGWKFVSRAEATYGVKHGTYYASLMIPKDFSRKIGSFIEEQPVRPQIEFQVNEKINAIAPKIATSGATGIVTQITNSFVENVADAIFSGFNQAGMELEKNSLTIQKVIDRLFELENALPQIQEMGQKAIELEGKLPELEQKAQKVIELEQKIPEIEQAGQQILKVESNWPLIAEAGQNIVTLQTKIADMQRIAGILQDMVKDLSGVQESTRQAIERLKEEAKKQAELTGRVEELERFYAEIDKIHASIEAARAALKDKVDKGIALVNVAGDFAQKELPIVEQKVHKAADFVRNDLPQVEQDIRRTSQLLQEKLPQVKDAVHKAADLARNDFPVFQEKVHLAADKIRQFQGKASLPEIIDVLKNNAKEESGFLASPVSLKTTRIFPIPNYGSAMNPFYTMLALWVGATLLVSGFRVDVENEEGTYKEYEMYFGRLFTFLTIALVQALIASFVNLYWVEVFVVHKVLYVLFNMLIGITFTIITYTLCAVFGNIGKGLAVILLVFQVSSSGGTFPVTVESPFFQHINPFMPFTYAVSLLREAVGGTMPRIVKEDIVAMLTFIGASFILALILKRPLSARIAKSSAKAKGTKLVP